MPNIVEITVRGINGTKSMFDSVRRDSTQLGRDAGENIATEASRQLRNEAVTNSGGFARAGDVIGDSIGRRVSERIRQRLRDSRNRFISEIMTSDGSRGGEGGRGGAGGRGGDAGDVTVDVNRQSIAGRMLDFGKSLGGRLLDGIRSSFTSGFQSIVSGDITSLILKGVTVASIVAVLAPVLGAAINSAFLLAGGATVIGAGIAAAFQDPKIKAAFKDFGATAKVEFAKFGEYFHMPLMNTLERVKRDLLPQLRPMAEELGRVFAPVTDNLGVGLIGFLQNLMPPLTRFIKESAPLWDTLSESLPQLGEDIGYFFDRLAEGAPAARVFLNDFLGLLGWIIKRLGDLVMWLSFAYTGLRQLFVDLSRVALAAFGTILNAATAAFGWIPRIGPALQGAQRQFEAFRKKANQELDRIEDEEVRVTITQVFRQVGQIVAGVAGQIGRALRGRATGGIIGAASGGVRGGLTWVGEHGPELIDAAPGSHVRSNPDSMRMAANASNHQPIIVQLMLDGKVVQEATIEPTRRFVRDRFGGNVQTAFGS